MATRAFIKPHFDQHHDDRIIEDQIIKDLFKNETIQFYMRYVGDTILAIRFDINLFLK